MRFVYGGALAALLLSFLASSASAEWVNAKCTNAAAIAQARGIIQSACGCTSSQTHGTYKKCVKGQLKLANLTTLIPDKPCRKLIMKCEAQSICGRTSFSVCCKAGKHNGSIVKTVVKCKNGSACGALLGRYNTSVAYSADGTCAGPTTNATTTSRSSTNT